MKRGPLQRKTPLRAGKPLTTKTPLRSGTSTLKRTALAPGRPPERHTPVRAVSTRKDRANRTRRALMQWLTGCGVRCEICPELAAHGIVVPGGCSGLGGIHERRKRSGVGSVEHAPNLIPCCNQSNGWVETAVGDDSARHRFGSWLVVRPEDDEWDALGGRDIDPEPVTVKLCERCGDAYVTVPPSGRLACGHRADPA